MEGKRTVYGVWSRKTWRKETNLKITDTAEKMILK
jgi:hypothetical protein